MVEHCLVYVGLVFKSPILHLKGGERSQGLMFTPHLPRAVLAVFLSTSQDLQEAHQLHHTPFPCLKGKGRRRNRNSVSLEGPLEV